MGNTDGYFRAVCAGIGNMSPSADTLAILNTWARYEGTVAEWNPLATTTPAPGSSNFNTLGGGQGVQNFADEASGANATARTLMNGHYPDVLALLRRNAAPPEWEHNLQAQAEIRVWGTHGFANHLAQGGAIANDYGAPSLPGAQNVPSAPPAPAPVNAPRPGQAYTIEPGDTLWGIATAAYGNGAEYPRIYDANRAVIGDNPSLITPGEVIQIPGAAPAPEPAPVTPPTPTHAGQTYMVQSGDSLWAIAQHVYGNGAEYVKIYEANRAIIGDNPSLIHPGQILTLPA